MTERLNKRIARAGLASRRAADRLIEEGRVTVNGQVVTELGVQVDPIRDAIKVDGKRLPDPPSEHRYFMLNKPRGCVTTLSDPEGRRTVRDLIPRGAGRVFPVGRLDYNSEGLLLLTDDGDLARDLMHPRSGVSKTYSVKVSGNPPEERLSRLRRGVPLDGKRTLPAEVSVVRRSNNSWIEVTVKEGRKHQVRRMLEAIGHPVLKLRRVRYDGLHLGDLAPGETRPISPGELARLQRAVGQPRTGTGRPARKRRSS